MKYATVSAMVTWSGGKVLLNAGSTTADDDHPLVRERPDLWTDEAPEAHLIGPKRQAEASGEQPVERATRAPGERRPTRRG